MTRTLKWPAVFVALAALTGGGAWGFATVFDHAGFAGGIAVSTALFGGMTAILLALDLKRLPATALGVLVWLGVVAWGLHMAQNRAVTEVAGFVRGRPALAARWGALPDDRIWRRFLAENGLDAEGPDLRSYLRLRAAQGIQVGIAHRRREVRGFWLYAEWMQLVLMAGLGAVAPAFVIASLKDG